MSNVRVKAAQALCEVIQNGKAFTDGLDTYKNQNNVNAQQKKQDELNQSLISIDNASKDRALYKELCYGVLRNYYFLNGIANHFLKKPFTKKDSDIHCLLLIGFYQLIFLRTPDHAAINTTVESCKSLKKIWAKGLINGVLRNFLRESSTFNKNESPLTNKQFIKNFSLNNASANAHPDWLFKSINQAWPEHSQQILAYNNNYPPMGLRINLQKTSRENYLQTLTNNNIKASIGIHSQSGLILDKPVSIDNLPEFNEGVVSVQDIGAQLAANLLQLKPEQNVLDACSAPGGKTAHILETQPNISLTAIDHNADRLKKVKDNLLRCTPESIANTTFFAKDAADTNSWWDGKTFDRILLDAPCSGTGVISHHPDIKILRRDTDINQFKNQQMQLLNALWPTLSVGGILVYCTCSILHEENSFCVKAFLQHHKDASEIKIDADWGTSTEIGQQLLPNSGQNGGFYYAVLSKIETA